MCMCTHTKVICQLCIFLVKFSTVILNQLIFLVKLIEDLNEASNQSPVVYLLFTRLSSFNIGPLLLHGTP